MKEGSNNTMLIAELQQLWNAERMLVNAMPLMIAKAKHLGLKKSLAHHHAETKQHEIMTQFILKNFKTEPLPEINQTIQQIIEEGNDAMSKNGSSDKLDLKIIDAALKIERYEISAYGNVAYAAEQSGHNPVALRLRAIQEEEQQSNGKLNFLKDSINRNMQASSSVK